MSELWFHLPHQVVRVVVRGRSKEEEEERQPSERERFSKNFHK